MAARSMSSPAEIGSRIRNARISRKMSQAALAEKANISLPHISEIEQGKSDIRVQSLIRIIEALQVSADEILCADVPVVTNLMYTGYAEVLSDCSPEEIRALIEITRQVKHTIRSGKEE